MLGSVAGTEALWLSDRFCRCLSCASAVGKELNLGDCFFWMSGSTGDPSGLFLSAAVSAAGGREGVSAAAAVVSGAAADGVAGASNGSPSMVMLRIC